MHLSVNGETRDGRDGMTVADLLSELSMSQAFIAVAVNDTVVRAAHYGETVLRHGDRVEILAPMSGG